MWSVRKKRIIFTYEIIFLLIKSLETKNILKLSFYLSFFIQHILSHIVFFINITNDVNVNKIIYFIFIIIIILV